MLRDFFGRIRIWICNNAPVKGSVWDPYSMAFWIQILIRNSIQIRIRIQVLEKTNQDVINFKRVPYQSIGRYRYRTFRYLTWNFFPIKQRYRYCFLQSKKKKLWQGVEKGWIRICNQIKGWILIRIKRIRVQI